MEQARVGIGFDVHPFEEGRDLVLGGVKIDFPLGLVGHSDADVLVHAIIDSLLGASGLGDIGGMFPDTDEVYTNASSLLLLEQVYRRLCENNFSVINIDAVVICEKPRISSHVPQMKENISRALGGLEQSRINVKGTTTEKLGFTGRGEGIASQAVALLRLGS